MAMRVVSSKGQRLLHWLFLNGSILRRAGPPRRGLRRGVLLWREVALRPAGLGSQAKFRKTPGRAGLARSGHELLVIGNIDLRQEHGTQHLVRLDEVVQVGARIAA